MSNWKRSQKLTEEGEGKEKKKIWEQRYGEEEAGLKKEKY